VNDGSGAPFVAHCYYVSGKVQGVFFRASTAQQATRLSLTGWARNLSDGRVEVLAIGELAAVSELGQWLAQGPPLARVRAVETEVVDIENYSGLMDFRTG